MFSAQRLRVGAELLAVHTRLRLWSCEDASKEVLAAAVLGSLQCKSTGGTWGSDPERGAIAGHCQKETALVKGHIINAGADVSVFVDEREAPDVAQNGWFLLSVDANRKTTFEIRDNASKRTSQKTVTLKPREHAKLEFKF